MLREAALEALRWAEMVHEMDCEARWPGWEETLPPVAAVAAVAAIQRRANPLLLMRYLPPDATDEVRREAERMLRRETEGRLAWTM